MSACLWQEPLTAQTFSVVKLGSDRELNRFRWQKNQCPHIMTSVVWMMSLPHTNSAQLKSPSSCFGPNQTVNVVYKIKRGLTLHSASSFHLKTYFHPLDVLTSVCRDAIIRHRALVEQILISCLFPFHADLHTKHVTVQRTGTPLQPGTQVINECLWVHAENIARLCSRVWVFAVIASTASQLRGSFTFFSSYLKKQGQPGVLGDWKKRMDVRVLFFSFNLS